MSISKPTLEIFRFSVFLNNFFLCVCDDDDDDDKQANLSCLGEPIPLSSQSIRTFLLKIVKTALLKSSCLFFLFFSFLLCMSMCV